MRISTTSLFFTAAFLFCSAVTVLAAPIVTITNIKNACGSNANGGFQVNVTGASGGALNKPLVIHVFGPPGYTDPAFQTGGPAPSTFTYIVNNALGDNSANYLVVVSDGTGNTNTAFFVYDYSVVQDVANTSDNNNTSCSPSNGKISVTPDPTFPGTIQYSWTGPGGFTSSSQNITGLKGGDYTLSYSDGTGGTCSLPPIHINDPTFADFTISGPSSICAGNGASIIVSATTATYTYEVVDASFGNTVIATATGDGSTNFAIAVAAAQLPVGFHSLFVRAYKGACTSKNNQGGNLNIGVNPTPAYNTTAVPAHVCSNAPLGINLTSFRSGSTNASSFTVTAIDPHGMTAVSGTVAAPYTTTNSADLSDDVWKNVTTAAVAVDYTITPTLGSCAGAPFTISVTIDPQPDFNGQTKTICSDDVVGIDLNSLQKLNTTPATTFNFTNVDPHGMTLTGGGPVALGNGFSNNVIADDKWENTTTGPLTVDYTIVPVSSNGCLGTPFLVSLTVTSQPAYTNLPPAPAVCSQTAIGVDLTNKQDAGSIEATSFTVTAIQTNGATLAGGSPSTPPFAISKTDLMDDQWKNVTASSVNVIYTIQPANGTCQGATFTVTVPITPEPDYVPSSSATAVCSDTATGVDLENFKQALSIIASTYDIVAINPDPLLTAKNVPALPRNGRAKNEIASDVWENLTATAKNVTYTVKPYNGACAGQNFDVVVPVSPEPHAQGNAPGSAACSGDAIAIDLSTLAVSGTVAADSYVINSVTSTGLTAATGPGSGTGANLIFTDQWVNTGSVSVPVTYNITPKTGSCVGDPFDVIVNIVPRPNYGPFNDVSGICAVPLGKDLTTFKNPGSPDATSFTLQSIAVSDPALVQTGGGPTVAGPIAATDLMDDIWSNPTSSTQKVTYNIIPTNGTCDGSLLIVSFLIKPQPVYTSDTPTVCSNIDLNYDLDTRKVATSSSADLFTFDSIAPDPGLTNKSASPIVAGSSQSGNTLSDKWENITSGPLTVVYKITPSVAGCAGGQFTLTFTINPEPVYTTGSPLPDICSEDAVAFDLESRNSGVAAAATTFDYTVSAPGLTPIGATNPVSGSGGRNVIAADQWKNTSGAVVQVTYTVTPRSFNACTGQPFQVVVGITPQPSYHDAPPASVCGGTNINVNLASLINTGSVVADSFEIVSVTSPNMTAGATTVTTAGASLAPGDLIDDTFKNVSGSNQTATYVLRPVKGSCKGDPITVAVTILPQPDYNTAATKTLCSRDAVAVDLSTLDTGGSIAADSYNVAIAADPLLTSVGTALNSGPGQDKNSIAGHQFKNTSGGPLQVIYTIIPMANGCAGDPPTIITITVNSEPVGGDDAISSCTNNAVGYDLQNNIAVKGNNMTGVSFSWVAAADNANVTGESLTPKTTATITDNLVNNVSTDQVVVYNVTPKAGTCTGQVFNITVTIVAKPVLATGQTALVCSGVPINYEILLNPAGLPTGTTFTWPAPIMSDGSIQGTAQTTPLPAGAAGTKHITESLINVTSSPITATYTVTPSINGTCLGTPTNIVVTINPGYVAIAGVNQTICTDAGPYQLVGAKFLGAANQGKWTISSNPGDGAIVDGGGVNVEGQFTTTPSQAFFTATIPGDYVLDLTTEVDPSGICPTGVSSVTITVTNKPQIVAPTNPILVCANDPVGYEIMMNPPNLPVNTVFNWPDPDGPTGITNATAGVNVAMGVAGTKHIMDVLRNTTNANVPVTYHVTASVGLCIGNTVDIEVDVKPSPDVVFGQTKTICSGEQVNYEILLNPANLPANTTFSWPDPDGAGSGTSKKNIPADPAGTFHLTDTLYNGATVNDTIVYSVIARGSNGCLAITRDVKIVVNPGAVADAGKAQSVCANGIVTLTGASVTIGGAAGNGTWSIVSGPSGGVVTNGATPDAGTFTSSASGTYKLRLTSDDPSGSCGAVTDDVIITVKAAGDPSCTGGGTTAFACSDIVPETTSSTCNNSDGSVFFNIHFTAPITGDIKITIDGPVQRVNFASVNGYTFNTLASGSYTYKVEYNGLQCDGTFSIDRSGTVGIPVATVVKDPGCFSDTGTATIDAPNQTGINLEWSADGINWTGFIGGAPVSGLPAGSNLIFVRRPGDPCAGGVVVTFNTPSDIPVTFTPANATCSGDDGSITVANNTGDAYSYQLNGASTVLTADNIFHGLVANTYNIVVKNASGCSKTYNNIIVGQVVGPNSLDTLYINKAISVPDLASGSALIGVKPSGLEPYQTRLELTTPLFGSQSYLSDWTDVPLNPQNLKFEQTYTNIFAGEYTLGLRDDGGCTKMYKFTIDVDNSLFIPNIFTPNNDGSNETFYIRNLPASDAKVLITNRWGKEVYKSSSYQNDWNGGDTVDGMYYYTVNIGGQKFSGWVEILRGQ